MVTSPKQPSEGQSPAQATATMAASGGARKRGRTWPGGILTMLRRWLKPLKEAMKIVQLQLPC